MDKSLIQWMPYQTNWLEDKARFKAGCFARQTGKTFVCAGEVVSDCVGALVGGKKTKWTILSRGERQAMDLMRDKIVPMTRAFLTLYKAEMDIQIKESPFETSHGFRFSKHEVEFPGGSRITAVPALGDTVRGADGNLLLDEFAFHDNSDELWGAVYPIISSNPHYKVRVISTPNGKNNKFYDLMCGEETGKIWSRHFIDIYEAVRLGLKRDINELKAGLNDEAMWAQEFELDWRDELTTWLPYELILACEDVSAGEPLLYKNGPCYVGIDIARTSNGDYFVIWVNEKIAPGKFITREVYAKKGLTYEEQDTQVARIFNAYKIAKCLVDKTGLGSRSAEEYEKKYGARVQGIQFTAQNKYDMAVAFKKLFVGRNILVPSSRDLREDLHSVEQRISGKNIKFEAKRQNGSHADRFWAGAMASYGGEEQQVDFMVHTRNRGNNHAQYGVI